MRTCKISQFNETMATFGGAPALQDAAGPENKALAALLGARVAPHVLAAQQAPQRRRQVPVTPVGRLMRAIWPSRTKISRHMELQVAVYGSAGPLDLITIHITICQ